MNKTNFNRLKSLVLVFVMLLTFLAPLGESSAAELYTGKVSGTTLLKLDSSGNTVAKKTLAVGDSYKLVEEQNNYISADDALNKTNPANKKPIGTYYVYKIVDGIYNLSATKDQPGGWVNLSESQKNILAQDGFVNVSTSSTNTTNTVATTSPTSSTTSQTSILKGYVTSSSGLIVRDNPNGNKVGVLAYQTYVEGTLSGAWLKILYNGKTAYVAATFVSPTKPVVTSSYPLKGYVNSSSGLLVRTSPNGTKIGIVPNRYYIEGTAEGSWVKFNYNNQTAYVAKYFVKELSTLTNQDASYIRGYVSSDGLLVRTSPNGSKLGIITKNTYLEGTIEGYWIRTTFNGRTAYVAKAFVKSIDPQVSTPVINPVPTEPVKVSGFVSTQYGLIVRNAPNGSKIGVLDYLTQVEGTLEGSWIKIPYNGGFGYVAKLFVDTVNPIPLADNTYVKGYVNSTVGLNVRSSKGGPIIGILNYEDFIEGQVDGSWLRIVYNGTTAYIAKAYIDLDLTIPPSLANTSDKFVLVLDPGHGPGILHNRGGVLFNEGDQNFKFSQYLIAEANKYDIVVKTTRQTNDDDPGLADRANMGTGADLFLSLHTNAMPSGVTGASSVRGVEVYSSNYSKNNTMAYQITSMVSRTLSTPNRGVKFAQYSGGVYTQPLAGGTDYYAVFRYQNSADTRYLIEFVFHTNYADSQAYLDNQAVLARNLMNIIANNYNLKLK